MSFLAPLYILGGLAISLPILFHLIRRQPKGKLPFSSVMFLRASPPRLTKRSRLENWPLLLVRAAVLGLLAVAFARPLLRTTDRLPLEPKRRTTLLLIDTSASMQRAGLWQQATSKASETIDALRSGDALSVVAFARTPRILLGWEQSDTLDAESLRAAARSVLNSTVPGWEATDLGGAIRFAVELAASRDDVTGDQPVVVELVSDMPRTGQIEKLQSFRWPDHVLLKVRRVEPQSRTNASLHLLADSQSESEAEATQPLRVRVTNGSESIGSSFDVGWMDASGPSTELPVQVPPGQSRVVRLAAPPPQTTALRLRGDDELFDNVFYYAPPEPTTETVLFIGGQPENPRDSLFHYLTQAPLGDRYRSVQIVPAAATELPATLDPAEIPLVVAGEAWPEPLSAVLGAYAERGGRILAVLADQDSAPALIERINQLTAAPLKIGEANPNDYAILSDIDFQHPLFESMSEPPYNDFSKIRFWSYRAVGGAESGWSVLASFDDGNPALLEAAIGDGGVWVLATGWQPAQSQLALSTKFVPMLFRMIQADPAHAGGAAPVIGEGLPESIPPEATITKLHGTVVAGSLASDTGRIDSPGVYQWSSAGRQGRFAVNLDSTECRTEAAGDDLLEQFGVKLGSGPADAEASLREERQLRDRELENRQRIWQWLLAVALGLVGLETWMGKRAYEPRTA